MNVPLDSLLSTWIALAILLDAPPRTGYTLSHSTTTITHLTVGINFNQEDLANNYCHYGKV